MSLAPCYCRISARLGSREDLERLTAKELIAEWYPLRDPAVLRSAQRFAPERRGDIKLSESAAISDACFVGYQAQHGSKPVGYVLASRETYDPDELTEIWQDLAQALQHRALSGMDAASIQEGRVLVHVLYPPQAGGLSSADPTTQVRGLFGELEKLHAAGLVHGGINERWLNPAAQWKVFGVGLSAVYAVWRRRSLGQIGLLVGDPRYAAPRELVGDPVCAEFDRWALGAVVIALCAGRTLRDGARKIWHDPVVGPDSFLLRVRVEAGDWLKVLTDSGCGALEPQLEGAFGRRKDAGPARPLLPPALAAASPDLPPPLEMAPPAPQAAPPGRAAWILTGPRGRNALLGGALCLVLAAASWLASLGTARCDDPLLTEKGGRCVRSKGVGRCGAGTQLVDITCVISPAPVSPVVIRTERPAPPPAAPPASAPTAKPQAEPPPAQAEPLPVQAQPPASSAAPPCKPVSLGFTGTTYNVTPSELSDLKKVARCCRKVGGRLKAEFVFAEKVPVETQNKLKQAIAQEDAQPEIVMKLAKERRFVARCASPPAP